MAVHRKKALLTPLLLGLLLVGCGSQPLSTRELVRAVFFGRDGGQSTVLLVLADQQAEEGEQGYKTAQGTGQTPAQALRRAEQSLSGVAFYGLMDVVGLPAETDWHQATEIGDLLYDQAKPTPELAAFVLAGDETPQNAGQIYEELLALQKNYGLHCGLQQLFEQNTVCALPVRCRQGYGFALLPKDREPVKFEDPLTAQLAALLCGYTDRLDCFYAGGNATVHGRAGVTVTPAQGQTAVQLHLKDVQTQALTDLLPDDASARATLQAELLAAFDALQAAAPGADPFRWQLWTAIKYGPQAQPTAPALQIFME